MIKNERQYKITKNQAERFQAALEDSTRTQNKTDIHPILLKAQQESLSSQLDDLLEEIEEYEALQSGHYSVVELTSLENFALALIQARIAAGLTQNDLAAKLGMREQQIQRYEATEYASASLAVIQKVIDALGISIREDIFLPGVDVSLKKLFSRLSSIGIDREFATKRLIPTSIDPDLEEYDGSQVALQIAANVNRVFGISASQIFGDSTLLLPSTPLVAARFKKSEVVNENRLHAFTVYAHYIAALVFDAVQHLPKRAIPNEADFVREAILSTEGTISFESALKYAWSLGIAVIPLADAGAFHGAFWRIRGRNLIILKQRNQSQARWLFDLLHEMYHAAQEPEAEERMIIEEEEITHSEGGSDDFSDSEWEEVEASDFADDVVLAGIADDLAKRAVERANGRTERLKAVVSQIAEEANVPVDSLANYIAYRLSLQGMDWWGAATNLQQIEPQPWEVAREFLIANVDLSKINPIDQKLLMQAISY